VENPAFEAFYRGIYGDRWEALGEALRKPARTEPYKDGLREPYLLDRASALAALSLRLLPEGGMVLDACAAPGGKSLVIASRLGAGSVLVANEVSRERRRRLQEVLDRYLDAEKRARVRVSGFDAAAQGGRRSERGRFTGVLLDAPCSSERHVIQSPAHLARWTKARPRSLAARQWSLLSAAFLLLREGGSLVYVTCSLNPEENGGVVGRLVEK
jgi:16S rRNA (cytosine1407-C5)-methyltransferase